MISDPIFCLFWVSCFSFVCGWVSCFVFVFCFAFLSLFVSILIVCVLDFRFCFVNLLLFFILFLGGSAWVGLCYVFASCFVFRFHSYDLRSCRWVFVSLLVLCFVLPFCHCLFHTVACIPLLFFCLCFFIFIFYFHFVCRRF